MYKILGKYPMQDYRARWYWIEVFTMSQLSEEDAIYIDEYFVDSIKVFNDSIIDVLE